MLVAGTVTGEGGTDGVLWSSPDGKTWSASEPEAPFAGPTSEGLRGIDVDGARVVVTGRDGDDLTVFTSADGGSTWHQHTAESFGGPDYQTAYPIIVGDEAILLATTGRVPRCGSGRRPESSTPYATNRLSPWGGSRLVA